MKSTKYTDSKSWQEALNQARKIVSGKGGPLTFLKDAGDKLTKSRPAMRKVWDDLQLLVRMLKSYHAGTYRAIPVKSMMLITASILYFINPLDFLPDLVPVFGLVDDATLIGFVVASLKKDINKFREWEIDEVTFPAPQVELDYYEAYD